VIVFRNVNSRYPFLWETASQPEARYHSENDGPAQYFADTSDGAWAEFVRHAEITDLEELSEVRRALWCVEISDEKFDTVDLNYEISTGDKLSYSQCQKHARSLRDNGITRLVAPSAAIKKERAGGFRVHNGLVRGAPKSGSIMVIFDILPNSPGWRVAISAPPSEILDMTNQL